jgi:hypothetical protein
MFLEQGPRLTIYKRKTNQLEGISWNRRIQQLQSNAHGSQRDTDEMKASEKLLIANAKLRSNVRCSILHFNEISGCTVRAMAS